MSNVIATLLFRRDKVVLDVGGGAGGKERVALPPQYAEFKHIVLDIDPKGSPDIVCDARELTRLGKNKYDAVYCSHNLEHYYRHEVPAVLTGIAHVLKPGGFVHVRVPDLAELMQIVVANKLDVEDVLYQSSAGPVTVLDVLYGYGPEIEQSGQPFYAHKTGFTKASLEKALTAAGFIDVHVGTGNLEINAIGFKESSDQKVLRLFGFAA